MNTVSTEDRWRFAAFVNAVRAAGCMTAQVEGHTLASFAYGAKIFAIDNRCPHMGFPLADGSIKDGILTCHWHHASFDLASGGAFDLLADDVRCFPIDLRDDQVWVNLTQTDAGRAPETTPAGRPGAQSSACDRKNRDRSGG